ncbi:MAG: flagellar basal body rod protein FlgC [Calditrichaeota bacterium]|nr:flagellar basal body rod protein FlgC [Calditrichota bacterium]
MKRIESFFTALNISASGLSAQRKKLDAIASNIANANTTRTEDGQPYRRKLTVMESETIPAFEKVLQKSRLQLEVTDRKHFPFKKIVRVYSTETRGVRAEVQEDPTDFRRVYDPTHPDADEEGYVYYPNINVVSEMVEMISATRSYEANLSSIEAAKKMATEALRI